MLISKIIVHASASPDSIDIGYREIKHLHTAPKNEKIDWYGYETRGRAWSDIGYHWIIRRDGRVEGGRSEDIPGAHAYGHNRNSIGVVWIGDKHIGFKQREQLLRVLRGLCNEHGVSVVDVIGHNELPGVNKACPIIDMNLLRGDLLFTGDEDEKKD